MIKYLAIWKVTKEKKFITVIALIVATIIASFFIEYFGFGHGFTFFNKENQTWTVKASAIETKNFERNESDIFTSQSAGAYLVIKNDGRHVNNLELRLSGVPNYEIIVKYEDPEKKKEIVLEKYNLKRSLEKSKTNFLDFLVFNIKSNPETIIIQASKPDISISEVIIDNSYRFNPYRFIFIFACFFLLIIFLLFRKKAAEKPEFLFLSIALTAGFTIAVTETRSFVSWDEAIHYKRTDDSFFSKIIKKDIKDVYSRESSVPFSYSLKEQSAIDDYFNRQKKKDVRKNKKDEFNINNFYRKIAYVPSGLALAVGRVLCLPYHLVFILGRLTNILLFSLIVFLAIRKLKSGKMIMSVIALFPTSIFLASNYGYDWWITAFTMLGLAYLFSELQQPQKKITSREIIIIVGSFTIGLSPKPIYFPLMFLLFLLGSSKFESKKQYRKFILVSVLSLLLVVGSFMLPFIINGPGKGDSRGGVEVNSTEQVKFILDEPIAYAKILFNFVKDYINPLNAEGFITSFAYLGSLKGFWLILTVLVLVSFLDRDDFDKKISVWKTKLLIGVVYLATVALFSTALYVSFTAVKSATIAGVQPRYLLPLVFPLLFVIGSSRLRLSVGRNIFNLAVFSVMTVVLMNGIWNLIVRFYF